MKVRSLATYEAVQYRHSMRADDKLPSGVNVVPSHKGDIPVVKIADDQYQEVLDGDWVLTRKSGGVSIVSNQVFHKLYEPIK